MKINVHFVWVGSYRPAWVAAHIAAWRAALPGCTVKLWEGAELEPYLPPDPGTEFAQIIGHKHRLSVGAWRANIARIRILDAHGGLYLDCDSLPVDSPYVFPVPTDDTELVAVKFNTDVDNCLMWAKAGSLGKAYLAEREMGRARHGLHLSEALKEGLLKLKTISPIWFSDVGKYWPKGAHAVHLRVGNFWMNADELAAVADYVRGEAVVLEFGAGGTTHELAAVARSVVVVDSSPDWAQYARDHVAGLQAAYYRPLVALAVGSVIAEVQPTAIVADAGQHEKPRVLAQVLRHAKPGTRLVVHDVRNKHFVEHGRLMELVHERCTNIVQPAIRGGGLLMGVVK